MRWVAGVLLVLATGLPGYGQASRAKQKAPNYYPMVPGTTWTYLVDSGNGKTAAVIARIAKTETIDGYFNGQIGIRRQRKCRGNRAPDQHA